MTLPSDPSDRTAPQPRRKVTGPALFLERANYRQRRLRDTLRMLPVLGAILFLIPMLWRQSAPAIELAPTDATGGTADAVLFVFVSWAFLIALAAFITRKMKPDADDVQGNDP